MQCCLTSELILLHSQSVLLCTHCILPCIALSFKTECKSSISIFLCGKKNHNCILFVFSHAAEPPRITTHPQEVKDAVPGKLVTFSIEATGTEPLSYQWEYNPDTKGWSEQWQPCSGSNTDTLAIPSVQKSNEGSYRCVVSNCTGRRTSIAAKLFDVGKNVLAL